MVFTESNLVQLYLLPNLKLLVIMILVVVYSSFLSTTKNLLLVWYDTFGFKLLDMIKLFNCTLIVGSNVW